VNRLREDFLGSDRRSVIVGEFAQVGVRKHVPLLRFGMAPLDRISSGDQHQFSLRCASRRSVILAVSLPARGRARCCRAAWSAVRGR